MKVWKWFMSGYFTFALAGLWPALYLYLSFGSVEPWQVFISLIKNDIFMQTGIFITAAHFFSRGSSSFADFKMKRPASALCWMSLALLICALTVSLLFRETEYKKISVSDRASDNISLLSLDLHLPDVITIAGENAGFVLPDIDAAIRAGGRDIKIHPFPFAATDEGYIFVASAGISPDIRVAFNGNSYHFTHLDMLPPAKRLVLNISPDLVMETGLDGRAMSGSDLPGARTYDLKSPAYSIKISSNDSVLFDGVMSDQQVSGSGGLKVTVGRTSQWIGIMIVRDRSIWLLFIALAGLIAGILMYPWEIYRRILS